MQNIELQYLKDAEGNTKAVVIPIEEWNKIEAYDYANKNTWTKEELEAYDYAAMREQDGRGRIAKAEMKAEQKGLERGLAKGLEEGLAKKEMEAVIGFHKIGLEKEKIAAALNISVEKVMQIIENQKDDI